MSLDSQFTAFASYGSGGKVLADMDNKSFLKCCKDSGLLDRVFTSTDVDLIFTKVKAKGERRINLVQFRQALEEIAKKKKKTFDEVSQYICEASPESNATKADAVKFHDDKSLYTGVYANGGPTNVDRDKQGLASHLDRTPADVRGVKHSIK